MGILVVSLHTADSLLIRRRSATDQPEIYEPAPCWVATSDTNTWNVSAARVGPISYATTFPSLLVLGREKKKEKRKKEKKKSLYCIIS
jgi:hypothetical protein